MHDTVRDVLILSLQFLYALGGVLVIGMIVYRITKHQDPDVELEPAPHGAVEGIAVRERRSVRSRESNAPRAEPGKPARRKPASAASRTARSLPLGPPSLDRYDAARRLVAAGWSVDDIANRVGLPQCDVELLADIRGTSSEAFWKRHPVMLTMATAGHRRTEQG